jgi:hypothetical protein
LHRRTGRRVGAPSGNDNRLVHGKRSKAYVERRRSFMVLLRMAREVVEAARRS